jgi:excisionase family DNA binding protein
MSSATEEATTKGDEMMRTTSGEIDPVLLRPEEVAAALGVGRTAVFELMRTGELRSVKIGKSRRIPTEAVREFVAGLSA